MKKVKGKKRFIGVCCAMAMILSSLPMNDLSASLDQVYHSLRALAYSQGERFSIDSKEALKNYAAAYDETHINDTIILTFGNESTVGEVEGFISIAQTEDIAFNGRIEIGDGMQLNLPTTMFGWVTDDVEIVKVSNEAQAAVLPLTRTKETSDLPLFAQHVKHNRDSGSADWSFQYDEYKSDDTTANRDVYNFAGYIGTLEENASVRISKIINNNQGILNNDATFASIVATGDAGLVCCTMGVGSTLEIDEITCESGNFTISGATAGGLVGSMETGSELILGHTTEEVDGETVETAVLSSVQDDRKAITATSGYAGGIVGSCKGVITFSHDNSSYSVNQIISGSAGSGAVAGYYETSSAQTASEKTNYIVDYSKFIVSGTCWVNGEGNCGGLFGEVLNDGDMTITDSVGLSANHGADAGKTIEGANIAATFGGLVGKYAASSLADSLTVTTTAVVSPGKSGGDAKLYGGIIGNIAGSSYVKFNGVQVNSKNANATSFFGGLAGAAASGFVELVGVNTISYSGADTSKNYGGVVGNLNNGVLILNGTTNLTNAQNVSTGTVSTGQIVGFRNCGFVWAENGWALNRQTTGQKLDDIGSWGEVLNYGGTLTTLKSDLITIADHSVTIKPAGTAITNLTTFAQAALNIQHNNSTGNDVLHVTDSCASSTLLGSDLTMTGSIDLTGTGLTGLTRDNGSNAEFIGTINKDSANSATITLATGAEWGATKSSTYGNGTIYRHQYNGLIAKTNSAKISGITIADTSTSTSKINVDAQCDSIYIGSIVAYASGNLTLDGIIVNGEIGHKGGGAGFRIGGFLGADTGNVNIGDTTACSFGGTISGTSSNSTIGGVIGTIANSNAFNSSIKNTAVSGTINSVVSATGGLIGTIADSDKASSSRTLSLNNTDISGLTITNTASGNAGGFLGYQWLRTDVTFDGVDVTGDASLTADSATGVAGLIYRGTGYYKVNAGGITLDSMSIRAGNATLLGLIVNQGYNTDKPSAIYLELGEHNGTNKAAFTATDNVSITAGGNCVFDELVASTGSGDIMANGHGIVSVNTYDGTNESSRLLKMGSSDTANTGLTYQNQTTYGMNHTVNPNTRYYYNLDQYRTMPPTDPAKLLVWSVRQYAHSSIQGYFSGGNVNSLTGTFAMKGYSYYPVNLSGTLTLSGSLELWSPQFDETENATDDKRPSTTDAQHKLMHNALLNNLSGTLNGNSLSLSGEVSKIDGYCGILVQGDVGSNDSGHPATVNVNVLRLDGVKIANESNNTDFAPLLIRSASSNSVFQIEDVANEVSYSDGEIIATSLLGNIGSENATNIKLNFTKIKLDGRKEDFADNSAGLDGLDSVYGTKCSLFRRATLLESFAYQNNSGSYGVYNYESTLDWGTNGTHLGQVTYGAEIDNTAENRDDSNESKQLKYNGGGTFTHPTTPNASAKYGAFATNFQRYVKSEFTEGGTNHELRVNISTTSFDGCGTYNDPYQITAGTDLKLIADLINGSQTDNITGGIKIPNTVVGVTANANSSDTWCHEKTDHTAFVTFNGAAETWSTTDGTVSITYAKLSEYLAGAYYVIPESVTDKIVLPSDFSGLSDSSIKNGDEQNVFRGVIIGNGGTIVNNTDKPLIVSSNGSVVKNLKIEVQPGTPMYLKMDDSKAFSYTGLEGDARCQAYGAVIGQIFGGDNIIDNVSVSFSGTVVDAKNAANGSVKSYAQSVPIGGYVGVVVNGGLIFRNMNGTVGGNQAGITKDNLANFDCPNTTVTDDPGTPDIDESSSGDPTSENEKKWLYVNPIIGRVINGYAVTEASEYAPYEHGVRHFGDGTSVTGNEVTMHNGTKNYSITNITNSLSELSLTDKSTISVPNGQAFFLMSIMVNSGMAKKSLGYNQNYQVSRYASYTNVGDTAVSSDYTIASSDALEDSGTKTQNPGYLAHAYTNNAGYAADMANQSTKITLENTTYVLPDGYKGIGNFFQNLDDYRLKVVNFTGNGATISQNSSYYYYAKEKDSSKHTNQSFDSEYAHKYLDSNVGFGLFNNQTGSTNNASSSRYYNFTLTGNIDVDCINIADGKHIFYLGDNTASGNTGHTGGDGNDRAEMMNAGMLMGVSDAQQTIDSVALVNVKIHGIKNTGGMIGCVPSAKTIITNTLGTGSERIIVHGAGSAGGVLGKTQQGEITIDNGGASYSITEIASECESLELKGDYNYGVGAFVGACRTSSKPIKIQNIVVGASDQAVPTVVRCDVANVFAGGMIGVLNKGTLTVSDCEIYNQSVTSPYVAGGLFGYYASAEGTATIDHVTVYAKNYKSDTITNPRITSNNKAVGGFFGAIKDEFNSGKMVISNSSITGYDITSTQSGGYAGGAVGLFGHKALQGSNKDITLSLNNITIADCTITANSSNGYAGGLVGGMAERNGNFKHLDGYNILTKNLSISGKYPGAICGKTFNADECVIKLAGFSRQTDDVSTMTKALVAYPAVNTTPFGVGGYVVFADYDDKASNPETQNSKFANFNTIPAGEYNATNWVPIGSRELTVEYKVTKNRNGDVEEKASEILNVTKSDEILMTGSGNNATPLAEGVTQEVSCSANKVGNVASMPDPVEVAVPDDVSTLLPDTISTQGFYVYYLDGNTPKYFTNRATTDGQIQESAQLNEARPWFFKYNSTGNTYRLYTYDINNNIAYVSRNSNANTLKLVSETEASTATNHKIFSWRYSSLPNKDKNGYTAVATTDIDALYIIDSSDNTRVFQHSGGGKNIRYYNGLGDAKFGQLMLKTVPETTYTLQSWTYAPSTTSTYYNSATNALNPPSTTASGPSEPNETQLQEYTQYCGTDDTSMELYTITRTYRENVYGYGDNVSPFVTTSPKADIVKSEGTPVQWLTGDGVAKVGYLNSTTYNILHDIALDTNKSYQNTRIPVLDSKDANGNYITMGRQTLTSILTDKMSGFTAAHKCDMTAYKGEEFPVLVIDDIGSVNHVINNYLKVLTNTDFNFYQTSLNSDVFNVVISKMQYSPALEEFVKVDGAAALRLEPNRYFKISATEFDNDSLQFSLLEVQFKDPGDPTKIVYHLYVPVVVTKMLHYGFTARFSSGTTYDPDTYPDSVRNLIENLGNPVTLKCTYTYRQTASDWATAINGGENVQRNYAKELTLKATSDLFPADAKLILVDPNGNKDNYYTTDFSRNSNFLTVADSVTVDGVTTVEYRMNLTQFTGSSLANLNDLMTVSINEAAEDKTLVEDNSNYTVMTNDTANGKKLRPATEAEMTNNSITKYAVSVSLPQGQTYPQEVYYLSVFTKSDPYDEETDTGDKRIYHYEISSLGTFGDTDYPSARVSNESPHLFLGNLYSNRVTLEDKNTICEMSKSNHYLEEKLTATVGFTQNAINAGITSYIQNDNVKVYQTFLTSLNMLNGSTANSRGLLVKPTATVSEYTVAGIDRLDDLEECKYSNSYVEIPNGYSIKNDLRTAAQVQSENHNITISATVKMNYASETLSFQFPESTPNARDKGTYVIGYSNISSSPGRGAASRASDNTEETFLPATRKLYYMRDVSPVEFHYNAVANSTVDSRGNGNYGQLGINANELTANCVQINTAGVYDISSYGLKSDANYMKIQVKLSKKSDYSTMLDIPTYLKDYVLYIKDDTAVENDTEKEISVDTSGVEYTYVIPLTELQTTATDVYKIPVNFKAYTGYNAEFEQNNNEAENKDMEYSNYRVTMTVSLLKNKDDSSPLTNSSKSDHVIYTNARLISDIVTPKMPSATTPDSVTP